MWQLKSWKRRLLIVLVTLCVVVVAVYSGYRIGSYRLDTSVPAVKMAKLGLRRTASTAYEGARVKPVWLNDGQRFVYNKGSTKKPDFQLVNPETNTSEPFLNDDQLIDALSLLFKKDIPKNPFPFERFSFVNDNEIEFIYLKHRVSYNIDSGVAEFVSNCNPEDDDPLYEGVARSAFPEVWGDEKERVSPDRQWVLTADPYNLFIRSREGDIRRLTDSGIQFAEWNLKYARWSPDSRFVVTARIDNRKSGMVPVVDWNKVDASVKYVRYPMAKHDLMRFHAAIFNIETGQKVNIDIGEEQYLRILRWLPDSSELLFALLSRDTKTISFKAVSPHSGNTRTLLTEVTDTFHMFPPNFIFRHGPDFHLLEDEKHFIWISDKSGYRQLYLYNLKGGLVRQLTNHPYPVASYGGYDAKSKAVLYTAHSDPERPYDTHVHTVFLDGGENDRLSNAPGQHSIKVSPSGRFYIDKFSTTADPPVVELRRSDGELVSVLSKGKRGINARFLAPRPEHFSALAADNKTTVHGVIFKPSDFDPDKKYPVIDAIYGGPFLNYVPYTYDARVPFFGKGLPELGYVVVVVDARGTPGRGKAFKDMVYGKLGQFEIFDHVAAIKSAAETRPWMDISRVGAMGHSYGGYFSVRALLQAPDFYKVAVASGIAEKSRYEVGMAIECYLGLHRDNPGQFLAASNASLAENLRGKLLMVALTSDVNTPLHFTFQLIDAFIKHRKPYDLLLMPGANHHFKGTDRRYFLEVAAAYFQEHL